MAPRITMDQAIISRFCEANQIRRMALFGSVLRDDFRPESDVDVLVEFEPGTRLGLIGLAKIEQELTDLIGRPVDLSTPGGLHERFRERVLAEAETIYLEPALPDA